MARDEVAVLREEIAMLRRRLLALEAGARNIVLRDASSREMAAIYPSPPPASGVGPRLAWETRPYGGARGTTGIDLTEMAPSVGRWALYGEDGTTNLLPRVVYRSEITLVGALTGTTFDVTDATTGAPIALQSKGLIVIKRGMVMDVGSSSAIRGCSLAFGGTRIVTVEAPDDGSLAAAEFYVLLGLRV